MLEIDLNHVCACQLYTITHKRFWTLSVMYMYAIQITNCINWIFSKCLYCVVMRYKNFFEHNLLHFFSGIIYTDTYRLNTVLLRINWMKLSTHIRNFFIYC